MKKALAWILIIALLAGLLWLTLIRPDFVDPVTEGPVSMGNYTCLDGDNPGRDFDGSFYTTWDFDLYPTGEINENGTWECSIDLTATSFTPHGRIVTISAQKIPQHVTVVASRTWDGDSGTNSTKRGISVHVLFDETLIGYGRYIPGDSRVDTRFVI